MCCRNMPNVCKKCANENNEQNESEAYKDENASRI